jgi:hypothetical protein
MPKLLLILAAIILVGAGCNAPSVYNTDYTPNIVNSVNSSTSFLVKLDSWCPISQFCIGGVSFFGPEFVTTTLGEMFQRIVRIEENQTVRVKLPEPYSACPDNAGFCWDEHKITITHKELTTQEFLQMIADQYVYEEETYDVINKPAKLIKNNF